MNLLIFRHGDAVSNGLPDRARYLTSKGKMEIKKSAELARQFLPELDMIVTSPLKRARESADILGGVYNLEVEKIITDDEIAFGIGTEIVVGLKQMQLENIALVGHMPTVSHLLNILSKNSHQEEVYFNTGDFSFIKFENNIALEAGKIQYVSNEFMFK